MVVDAVDEMGKGFLMVFAQENEAGVGGDGERFFLKAVEVAIHCLFRLILSPSKALKMLPY
jgi:hypothetical protein